MNDFAEFSDKKPSIYVEKCNACVYLNAPPSEGWCYLFAEEPIKNCTKFVISADARVIAGINSLERAFPERFSND